MLLALSLFHRSDNPFFCINSLEELLYPYFLLISKRITLSYNISFHVIRHFFYNFLFALFYLLMSIHPYQIVLQFFYLLISHDFFVSTNITCSHVYLSPHNRIPIFCMTLFEKVTFYESSFM